MHVSGHEAVVRMDEFPSTAVQAGLLLSVQSSVVQAGHTALETQFCHPIVAKLYVGKFTQVGLVVPQPATGAPPSPPPPGGGGRGGGGWGGGWGEVRALRVAPEVNSHYSPRA